MKKTKIIFITTLLLLIMISGTVFATTKSESGYVQTSSYKKTCSGISSNCIFVGDDTDVYSIINNLSSDSRYLTTVAWEYSYNIGWTAQDEDSKTVKYGYQVTSEVARNKKIDGYYHHVAKCYANPYSYHLYDSYTYKAIQIH